MNKKLTVSTFTQDKHSTSYTDTKKANITTMDRTSKLEKQNKSKKILETKYFSLLSSGVFGEYVELQLVSVIRI